MLFKNSEEKKSKMVFEFLDFFMGDSEVQLKSSRSLLAKTNKLIGEISGLAEEEIMGPVITKINSLSKPLSSFVLLVIEMGTRTGIMLLNLSKCRKEQPKDYQCHIRPTSLNKMTPALTP
jgi:sensor c-di-GMP phosphodiesterase-like protein